MKFCGKGGFLCIEVFSTTLVFVIFEEEEVIIYYAIGDFGSPTCYNSSLSIVLVGHLLIHNQCTRMLWKVYLL